MNLYRRNAEDVKIEQLEEVRSLALSKSEKLQEPENF